MASDAAVDDKYVSAVGISGDTAIVGAAGKHATGKNYAGAAYVVVRVGASWSEQLKEMASDAATGGSYGYSVGIVSDTIVVGASGDFDITLTGTAYVVVRVGPS